MAILKVFMGVNSGVVSTGPIRHVPECRIAGLAQVAYGWKAAIGLEILSASGMLEAQTDAVLR
jgi:hypothetical protein